MGDEAAENLRLMIEFAKRGQIPQIEGFLDEQVPINGVDHLGCTGTEPKGVHRLLFIRYCRFACGLVRIICATRLNVSAVHLIYLPVLLHVSAPLGCQRRSR